MIHNIQAIYAIALVIVAVGLLAYYNLRHAH